MSTRRARAGRLPAALGAAIALLLAACNTVPGGSSAAGPGASTGAPAAVGAAAPPPLRPLARRDDAPADAPRSRVAAVRYDLAMGGDADLPPDDGVPGDSPPGEVFQRGGASYYGLQFHQRKTASGERFDMGAMTAAHKTLPFGTKVCVRSLVNGREVLVRINDRGPYVAGRIIDLSQAAAESLQMIGLGIKQVTLTRIDTEGGRCNGRAVAASGDGPADAASDPIRPARNAPAARKKPPRRR